MGDGRARLLERQERKSERKATRAKRRGHVQRVYRAQGPTEIAESLRAALPGAYVWVHDAGLIEISVPGEEPRMFANAAEAHAWVAQR